VWVLPKVSLQDCHEPSAQDTYAELFEANIVVRGAYLHKAAWSLRLKRSAFCAKNLIGRILKDTVLIKIKDEAVLKTYCGLAHIPLETNNGECDWEGLPLFRVVGPLSTSRKHCMLSPQRWGVWDAELRGVYRERVRHEARQSHWATPVVGDAHLSMTKPLVLDKNGDARINTTLRQVCDAENYQGQLNPRWVEVLMGLPCGWVQPSCVEPRR